MCDRHAFVLIVAFMCFSAVSCDGGGTGTAQTDTGTVTAADTTPADVGAPSDVADTTVVDLGSGPDLPPIPTTCDKLKACCDSLTNQVDHDGCLIAWNNHKTKEFVCEADLGVWQKDGKCP